MSEISCKWEDFAPKIIQTDKRERENVALKGIYNLIIIYKTPNKLFIMYYTVPSGWEPQGLCSSEVKFSFDFKSIEKVSILWFPEERMKNWNLVDAGKVGNF